MRARTLGTISGLLAITLLCSSCGGDPEPTPLVRTPHWRILEREGENAALVLPDARFAVADPDGSSPRLILNVLPTGDVNLKGHVWHFLADDEKTREDSRAGLRAQLTELIAAARGDADVAPPTRVLLHVDREAPWRAVRELLRMLGEPDLGTRDIRWAVRTGETGEPGQVEGTLDREPVPASDPLLLRIASDQGEAWTVVRVLGPERIHSLGPQPKVFARKKFVDRANRAWDDLERKLPALAEGHGTGHVVVEDERADVWFAYVAKTVDLLFGAGFDEVRLPAEGLVLWRPAAAGGGDSR